jgi:hypothetical protein
MAPEAREAGEDGLGNSLKTVHSARISPLSRPLCSANEAGLVAQSNIIYVNEKMPLRSLSVTTLFLGGVTSDAELHAKCLRLLREDWLTFHCNSPDNLAFIVIERRQRERSGIDRHQECHPTEVESSGDYFEKFSNLATKFPPT